MSPTTHNPTAYTADSWISRDDMAILSRKSADTIGRDCAKHTLKTQMGADGRVEVRVADFLKIGRIQPEDLTVGGTPAESAEVLRARDTITALKVQTAELTGRLAHSDALLDILREQLASKDRQISRQADQVSQLIGRLGHVGGAA